MDSPILTTLARYKFRTNFHEDFIEHITHTSDLRSRKRRVEVKTKWTREKELGSGAFGIVWREREGVSKELRAVKVIPKRLVNTREIEALAQLQDHPELFVLFLGWFEDGNSIYLAMEYIEYGDLGQYIRADPTRAKEGAQVIASQILEGLVVLHGREICHRDMKPQNILIASIAPLWVKISDFGISKRAVGTALRTSCGTMGYKSPEQHRLLPRHMCTSNQYTTAVDIWALGVIIHEVLTSEIPFLDTYQFVETSLSLSMNDMGPQLDTQMLYNYCHGSATFPIACLQRSGVGEEGIDFVKSLMVVNPTARATARDALNYLLSIQAPWAASPPAVAVPAPNAAVALSPAVVVEREKTLEKDHADTLQTVHGMAVKLFYLTKYDEALELYGRALAGREKTLGKDHADTLQTVHSMGAALYNQGKYDEALECYRRALAGREKTLGKDHADTLAIVTDMAAALYKQGKYDEVLECYRRALAGSGRTLGRDHADTLQAVHGMAVTLHRQGKYDEALKLYRRALAGREKTLGMYHADTLQTVLSMARTLHNQGMYHEAVEFYGRALSGREKTLGMYHADTLQCLDDMAVTLYYQTKYDEALECYRRALAGREKTLGKDHADTLQTVHNMAAALYNQGKYDEALECYRRALAGREKTLGKDHADTLQTVHNMAVTLHDQGKYDEALKFYRRALAGREKTLGKDHAGTQSTANAMGRLPRSWGLVSR